MSDFIHQHCVACEGEGQAFGAAEIAAHLAKVSLWSVNAEGTHIHRHFNFKNFLSTMAFANAVAWLAHQQQHHPLMEIGYKHCTITYTTDALSGLSINDFICAAKIDALL